jgi:hypothetical protein
MSPKPSRHARRALVALALALAPSLAASPLAAAPRPAAPRPAAPSPAAQPNAAPSPGAPPPASPAPARGEGPPPTTPAAVGAELQAAERAYTNLEYAAARDAAERLLRQNGLSHDQLVRATRLLALTSAALDRGAAAKEAFIALIAYDPAFQLDPKLGPRFQDPYYEAKGYWQAQARRPGIETTALLRPHAPGAMRVSLADPTGLADHVRVGFRWSPARAYTSRRLAPGEAQFDVPPPPPGSARFDYYAQAIDRRGDVIFERGTPEAPRSAVVLDTSAPPAQASAGRSSEGGGGLLSKPLFWVATGLVLVGGAAGTYFLLRDEGGQPGDARVTPTLGCGGVRCE